MRSTAAVIEARLVQRQPQQVEGLVLVLLQRPQRAAHGFAAGADLQLDRLALHAGMEGGAVEVAGAFVERRDRHFGKAALVLGILHGAAAERELDRDQRHGAVAHEPEFDAGRG